MARPCRQGLSWDTARPSLRLVLRVWLEGPRGRKMFGVWVRARKVSWSSVSYGRAITENWGGLQAYWCQPAGTLVCPEGAVGSGPCEGRACGKGLTESPPGPACRVWRWLLDVGAHVVLTTGEIWCVAALGLLEGTVLPAVLHHGAKARPVAVRTTGRGNRHWSAPPGQQEGGGRAGAGRRERGEDPASSV